MGSINQLKNYQRHHLVSKSLRDFYPRDHGLCWICPFFWFLFWEGLSLFSNAGWDDVAMFCQGLGIGFVHIFHPTTLDETPMSRIQVIKNGSGFPSYSNDWCFTFTMGFPMTWAVAYAGGSTSLFGKFQWTDAAGRYKYFVYPIVNPSWGWFAGLHHYQKKHLFILVTSCL